MAIVSIGYDGTVDETQWAQMVSKVGVSEYGVDRAGDFATSIIAGDRAVAVAPGTAWGMGVLDVSDSAVSVLLDSVTTGSRWDLIVLRRDWTPPGGSTVIAVVKGSSAQQIPSGRNMGTPGVLDDQPLALVRVMAGSTAVQEIVDLRVWSRNGGMLFAKHDLVRSYTGAIGTEVNVDGILWQRTVGVNSAAVWQRVGTVSDSGWVRTTSGFAPNFGGSGSYMVYRVKNGMCQFRVRFSVKSGTVDNPSNGNIENTKIATAPVPSRPADDWMPLSSGVVGPVASGTISPNGDVTLTAVAPGEEIKSGREYSLGGMYFVD
ncbi:hypothetical protein [Glutamicibacter nicotianae]|uniref:hypothetical protein n=1 Tax=Glutamicibacter nicotianae TaxID=37929 RepID=UPI00167F5DE5|nr:hypothetical protein [Glutamicibacter nicotianae]